MLSGAPRFATSDTYVFREYCREKEKFHKIIFDWSIGAQVEFLFI